MKNFTGITEVKNFKKGEYIIRANSKSKNPVVYVRGDYDKSTKKYELYRFDDINACIYVKGNALFTNDFIF